MKLNAYFFKKHWHILRRKTLGALHRARKSLFELLGRLSRGEDAWARLRENTYWKESRSFFNALYTRLVIRSEYCTRDLAVLFIIAFFVGVGMKTAATQAITIGFDDYTLPPRETLLDLNAVQKEMIENGSALAGNNSVPGGACSE